MSKTIAFYFDFGSPNAYLAYTQLPGIAARTGATIAWRPMLLGGVFKATGNASPAAIPAKGRYMGIDMARFVKRYGVPFQRNPHFPVNTLAMMRGAIAFQREGDFAGYVKACFEAMWVEGLKMDDPAVMAERLAAAGFDPADVAARIADPDVKQALIAATEAAVEAGVFGAPSFTVDGELFFGQDRLPMVEEAVRTGAGSGDQSGRATGGT